MLADGVALASLLPQPVQCSAAGHGKEQSHRFSETAPEDRRYISVPHTSVPGVCKILPSQCISDTVPQVAAPYQRCVSVAHRTWSGAQDNCTLSLVLGDTSSVTSHLYNGSKYTLLCKSFKIQDSMEQSSGLYKMMSYW